MLQRIVDEKLTSYETERELGRGKRKIRPPTIYTDDDEDSHIPKHYKKKQQPLLSDSDSDSFQYKKIRKHGKTEKLLVQDIPAPPPLSFQNRIGSMRPDQNDKNKKINKAMKQNDAEDASSLMKKIRSQQTESQVASTS